MREISTQSKRDVVDIACQLLSEACAERGRAVLLVATYDDTVRMKHELAEHSLGFGVDVETPASWVADLWEIFGDGRVIATSMQTALFVRSAFKQYRAACFEAESAPCLELTAGTERLIRNVLEVSPSQVIAAANKPELYTLTPAQQAAVQVGAAAQRLMVGAGLVLRADVCGYLAKTGAISDLRVVVLDCNLQLAEESLLEKALCDVISVEAETALYDKRAPELNELIKKLYQPDFDHPIKPTGALRFAYPAGEYASSQLIADEIKRVLEQASDAENIHIGITAVDPLRLFDELAPRLRALGASVKASGALKFCDTAFGRAWSSLLKYVLDEEKGVGDVHFAGDFALSAFSTLNSQGAFAADAAMRSWRGETIVDGLDDIKQQMKENWQEFITAIEQQNFVFALDAQMRWVQSRLDWSEGFRSQQINAILSAKNVHEAAVSLGLVPHDALQILQETMVSSEVYLAPTKDGTHAKIDIGTMAQLAGHEPCSFDAIVLTHMDANQYPLKDEESATDMLLQALGAWKAPRRIENLRLRFARCLSLACNKVVIHRALNNEEASELRPSALIEELIDCYRQDPRNAKEVDKLSGLPQCLADYCISTGEDNLSQLLVKEGACGAETNEVSLAPLGDLSPTTVSKVMPASLSASALELYVACPHKWFVNRRLGLEGIDAELGPIARGNCAHAVLERVHERIFEQGLRRVTKDNLGMCKNVLRESFDNYVENQKVKCNPADPNAYLPITEMERLDSIHFREQLCDFLEWEIDLLPAFSLYKQEFKFGFGDDETEYAGVLVRGSIDRIDVDEAGNAVIIDYKGSSKQEHCRFSKNTLEILKKMKEDTGGGSTFVLPESIQALMYAQIVRRKLGLNPVGAFYVSYGKNPGMAGAYEHIALRADVDLPEIDVEKCAVTDFLKLLDETEHEIERRITHMKAGDIKPNPYTKNACNYCLAPKCAIRDALGIKGVN